MLRIPEAADRREMIRAGLGVQLRAIAGRLPCFMERGRLARRLIALLTAPSGEHRRRARADAEQRRVAPDDAVVELDRRLQVAVAQRLDVVDAAHQERGGERIAGEAVVL